jgi:putative spermidine/putrescine transport system permease protein
MFSTIRENIGPAIAAAAFAFIAGTIQIAIAMNILQRSLPGARG